MGYYTRFQLEVDGEQVHDEADQDMTDPHYTLVARLHQVSGYEYLFEDDIKWYDFDKNMRQVSREFPDKLFVLSGEGEESGDLWTIYYKNGKSQEARAEITYAPFDESKLK